MESSPRGKKQKQQKTERGGQEMYTNICRRKSYLAGRPLALVVVDVDVHIFNTKTKLKGV